MLLAFYAERTKPHSLPLESGDNSEIKTHHYNFKIGIQIGVWQHQPLQCQLICMHYSNDSWRSHDDSNSRKTHLKWEAEQKIKHRNPRSTRHRSPTTTWTREHKKPTLIDRHISLHPNQSPKIKAVLSTLWGFLSLSTLTP